MVASHRQSYGLAQLVLLALLALLACQAAAAARPTQPRPTALNKTRAASSGGLRLNASLLSTPRRVKSQPGNASTPARAGLRLNATLKSQPGNASTPARAVAMSTRPIGSQVTAIMDALRRKANSTNKGVRAMSEDWDAQFYRFGPTWWFLAFSSTATIDSNTAKARCQEIGGTLAAPQDADANTAMASFLSQSQSVVSSALIGLAPASGQPSDDRTGWTWTTTQQSPSYDAWDEAEPNNASGDEACAALKSSGKWMDIGCAEIAAFVCEVPVTCTFNPSPPDAANAQFLSCFDSRTSYAYGKACNGQCYAGYEGTVQATCGLLDDTDWSFSGTCSPVQCTSFPNEPEGGVFNNQCSNPDNPTPYDVDGVCTGSCTLGYEGTVTATCTVDGTWDVVNSCTPVLAVPSTQMMGDMVWAMYSKAVTFSAAQAKCEAIHGTLVSLQNSDANAALLAFMSSKSVSNAWIGLATSTGAPSKDKNDWKWTSDGASAYDGWAADEPNNYGNNDEQCAAIYNMPWAVGWLDVNCAEENAVVCQLPVSTVVCSSDPDTTGTWHLVGPEQGQTSVSCVDSIATGSYGTECQKECDAGYVGGVTARCVAPDTWDLTANCDQGPGTVTETNCEAFLDGVPAEEFSPDLGSTNSNCYGEAVVGSVCQLTCPSGKTGSRTATCTDAGTWSMSDQCITGPGGDGSSGPPQPTTDNCPGCRPDSCELDYGTGAYKCKVCHGSLVLSGDDSSKCACPAGKYAIIDNSGAPDCTDCPKGSFCPGGLWKGANDPKKEDCAELSEGLTTVGKRSTKVEACVNQAGYSYSLTDGPSGLKPQATVCKPDTYSPGLKKQRGCVQCPAGFTTNGASGVRTMNGCVVPAGYYLRSIGSAAPCPKGQYRRSSDPQDKCLACIAGVTTEKESAATSPADCSALLQGYYAKEIDASG